MSKPELQIPVLARATHDNFDSNGYLWANPDIAAAANASEDGLAFAAQHFSSFGVDENRAILNVRALSDIAQMREEKFAKLRARSPVRTQELVTHRYEICEHNAEAKKQRGKAGLPVPYERISWNMYDPAMDVMLDQNPSQLFLDVGAGLRPSYRANVVYVEIAELPTTDVLCFGDDLPFDDGTFDGVLCLAVLEHVPDPFTVAEELMRVVRPGGTVEVDWPFLQPLHGYPHHYFNATPQGIRQAFERINGTVIKECYIPWNNHPVFSLRWMIDEWAAALTTEQKEAFLTMSLGQVLDAFTGTEFNNPWTSPARSAEWVEALPDSAQATIAAGTRIVVEKT